ncbi:glycosyltransferase family 2 protein, partial [Spirillospora sp. NPDC049652]
VGEDERPDPVTEAMAASPLGRPGDLPGPAVLGFLACSAIVRRDAFLDVGGFSETLHFGGEEELLALDLAAAGWGLAYVPELTVHHHPSSLGRNAAARRRREVRNRLLTAWLRRPARALAREVATAVRSREGRRGAVDAVRALPSVLRERRPVPPEVEAARRTLSRY